MACTTSLPHRWLALALIGLLPLLMALPARACDTPVYRYAMYRWLPSPYELYYFHGFDLDDQQQALLAELTAATRHPQSPANFVLKTVDVRDEAQLQELPPEVQRAWEKRAEGGGEHRLHSALLAFNPAGIVVPPVKLDSAIGLIRSPLREQVAQQLEEGAAGVMVLLKGSDDEANAAAEKAIAQLAADFEAGKIPVDPAAADPLAGEEARPQPQQLGFVKLSRDNPAEAWFLATLLAVEDDLIEFNEEPMVFTVFGRGRALPPFIGKGITRDNLLEAVYFVTGACSCTVKEQNPGMDLLMAYDWELTAENLAEKFGSEEGNAQFGEELFPDLILSPPVANETPPTTTELPVDAADNDQAPPETAATEPPEECCYP